MGYYDSEIYSQKDFIDFLYFINRFFIKNKHRNDLVTTILLRIIYGDLGRNNFNSLKSQGVFRMIEKIVTGSDT